MGMSSPCVNCGADLKVCKECDWYNGVWISKDQYENHLKADMVAMLTDLSMKIGEIDDGYTEFDEENKRSLTMIPLESVERLIDREINSLKAESEPQERIRNEQTSR